jgi:Mg2+ and Co2+ transporter CorA
MNENYVIDVIANLARRVSSLERQLADTQRNLETFAEQTESNTQDIAMLDERTQPQSAEVFTFEKFLDSIADKVAERLVGGERR